MHNIAATHGQYLTLSKAWQSCLFIYLASNWQCIYVNFPYFDC